jgi:hypothetical protein
MLDWLISFILGQNPDPRGSGMSVGRRYPRLRRCVDGNWRVDPKDLKNYKLAGK